MSFSTISAILRGHWLIDKQFAQMQLPLVMRMLSGEKVDFGGAKMYHDDSIEETEEQKNARLTPKIYANTTNVYVVNPYSKIDSLPYGSIGMLNITGPILKYGDFCSYGSLDHVQTLNKLISSNNISGIILNIDSPGGQADGTATLADAVKAADYTKPVVAIIQDGMAASSAMWVASAAKEIYVTQKTDQVGSIGVYTTIADWNKHYADYYKLPVTDVYAPESTDKNKNYKEALNGDTSQLEYDLSVLAQQFISTVSNNRSGKIKGDKWKTGKMFYANDATNIGLIDGIKSFNQVVKRVEKLSKQNSNSNTNTMAFEKTLAAAQTTVFAVVDGGFLATEEQLINIEAALTENAVNADALVQANAMITDLQNEKNNHDSVLSERDNTITELKQERDLLKAEVDELKKMKSGGGTVLPVAEDATTIEVKSNEKITLNHPDHPVNVQARQCVEASKKAKEAMA